MKLKKNKTTDVHLSVDECIKAELIQNVHKKTEYFEYDLWVRSPDEVKLNISQNISKSPTGGEYFSPIFRPHWNEHGKGHEFKLEDFDREDVWLDAGGHIGLFATRMLTQFPNIKRVISYEPFRNNIEFAELNLTANGVGERCDMVEAALVADDQKTVDFYLAWDSGKHSLLEIRGRNVCTVPCKNFNEALEGVTAIKMDIEGAEYDLIKSVNDWSNIRVALIEYHFHYRHLSEGRVEKFNEIMDIFKANFDDVYVSPGVEHTKNWITHFAAVKRDK